MKHSYLITWQEPCGTYVYAFNGIEHREPRNAFRKWEWESLYGMLLRIHKALGLNQNDVLKHLINIWYGR